MYVQAIPLFVTDLEQVSYSYVVFGEDGFEFIAGVGDVLPGALFSVDYADDFLDGCAGLGDDLGGFEDLAAGGGDVLDKQDHVAFFQDALD